MRDSSASRSKRPALVGRPRRAEARPSTGVRPAGGSERARRVPAALRLRDIFRTRRRGLLLACQVLLGVILLLAWQYASTAKLINPVFYSSPTQILALLGHQIAGQRVYGITLYQQIWVTSEETLIGYAIGSAAGILLGFAAGRSLLLSRALEPYVLTFYAVPKISIAPLFIIILGIGLTSKVAIVLIEAFFILFYNTLRGVLQVNEELVQVAKVIGAPRRTVLLRVLLPASLPSILAGLQLAVPFAVIGAVVGEYVSSSRGLGWLVLYSGSTLNATQLFAAIVLLIVLVWVLTRIVEFCVRRLAPWLPRGDEAPRERMPT